MGSAPVGLSVFISILLAHNISGTVKMIVGLMPVIVSLIWYIIVHIKYPPDKKQKKQVFASSEQSEFRKL